MAIHENVADYIPFSNELVGNLAKRYGLELTRHDRSGMGEWYVYFESPEFILGIGQDRIGFVSVEVGSTYKKKSARRGPWSMGHLRGFLDGHIDHFQFNSVQEEVSWLETNASRIFDAKLLNSDDLKRWAVKASQRSFGKGKDGASLPNHSLQARRP